MVDLEIPKKDSDSYVITIKENGVAVDITGYTFIMSIKEDIDDTDANVKVRKKVTTHSDPTNGETTISLASTDTDQTVSSSTQKYVYDIVMKDTSNEETQILSGNFKIKQRVTIST